MKIMSLNSNIIRIRIIYAFIFMCLNTGCTVIGLGTGAIIGINTKKINIIEDIEASDNITGKCKIFLKNGEEISGICKDKLINSQSGIVRNNYLKIQDSIVFKKDIIKIEKDVLKKNRIGGLIMGGLIGFVIDVTFIANFDPGGF